MLNLEYQGQLLPIAIDSKAYRFFPTCIISYYPEKQQKTSFDKKGTRFIYHGQIQHDDYEKKKLKKFQDILQKQKFYLNEQYWTNQRLLKFLSGRGYNYDQACQAIKLHNTFRQEYLGINNDKVLFDPVADLIRSGFIYVCGRDKYFRPIIVFNARKVDLQDPQKSLKATILVQEQVMKRLFLPGQVENWCFIYDLGQMGITQIPIGDLKAMFQKIALNYGGRLYRMWVVNAPMTVAFSWKIVSAFLDQVTVDKIKISKKNTDKDIFSICDPSQVQKKYGGNQDDRKQYWPLTIPSGVFDQSRLISQGQYEKMVKNGKLSRNIINPKYR